MLLVSGHTGLEAGEYGLFGEERLGVLYDH